MRLALIALLLVLPGLALAQNQPSPSNVVSSVVTCSSTISVLAAAKPGRYHRIIIQNTGTNPFYIGGTGITSSTGFEVLGTAGLTLTVETSGNLYCITSSSTSAVDVLELF